MTMTPLPKRTPETLSVAEREALIAKPIVDCSQEEKDLKLVLLEERVKGLGIEQNLAGLGPDDEVYITVPLKPDNHMFEINHKLYYGRLKVEKRTAEQLMSMVSDSYRIERERLQSRGNASKDTRIRGEHNAQIERYTQMMEG